MKEIYLNTLEALKTNPKAYAYGLIAKEDITAEKLDELKGRVEEAYAHLKLTTDWDEAFNDADFVIESVAEEPKQKIAFYSELAKHLPEKTVIATNSSTMIPSMFAEHTGRPEKYLALHFANEIWIRMIPVKVLKEQPGYLLNSMLVPFLSAAEGLWAGGVGSPEDIDRAWMIGTGAPAGPFRILDIIGLTTAYNVGMLNPKAQQEGTIENRIVTLLKEKIDAGELGINAGKGFYTYGK